MFSGIITNLGYLTDRKGATFTFRIPEKIYKKLNKGSSIAVDGVCLTVFTKINNTFSAELMPETLKRTNFNNMRVGELVNLELPLTPTDFLSGHIVQGHIDGIGTIERIKIEKNSKIITVKTAMQIADLLVEKGSIALNGVSLTIIKTHDNIFEVGLIPYTWKQTSLRKLKLGDFVNIEVDIMAKYIKKLLK